MKFDNIWVEHYRPSTVADIVLPQRVKTALMELSANKDIPTCVFTSDSPGTGKTTAAKALCNDIGADTLYINASIDNSIDDVRTKVVNFASTVSISGNIKVIILDEADRLSAAAQDALKGVIEQVHKSCRFIFTANNRSGLTPPLLSRCTLDIDFSFVGDERKEVELGVYKVCVRILDENKIEYDKKAVAALVKQLCPDNRKIIQVLQEKAMEGSVDLAAITAISTEDIEKISLLLINKNFAELKEYTTNRSHRFSPDIYSKLYQSMYPRITGNRSKCDFILILNDYQRQHKNVPDKFIHFLAMFVSIMEILT